MQNTSNALITFYIPLRSKVFARRTISSTFNKSSIETTFPTSNSLMPSSFTNLAISCSNFSSHKPNSVGEIRHPCLTPMILEIERYRLYYHHQMSNMSYETKSITFHIIHVKVSSNSRCSRTLPRMLQLRVHIVIVIEIRARIEFGLRCVESIGQMWSTVQH